MKKLLFLLIATMMTCTAIAQEKVMNVMNTDGTTTQTRVAEMDEISFLTVNEGGQGLLVKTTGGETVSVLFDANPVVTISKNQLIIKSDSADAIELDITDIAEILFGDASDPSSIREVKGFSCIFQEDGALLRGIPDDISPRVYSIDGRSLPTPHIINGELHLSRATLGTGVFIVKVGSFSTKIKL